MDLFNKNGALQFTPASEGHLSLTSSYSSYSHGQDVMIFFCEIAVFSVLNRFVQLG